MFCVFRQKAQKNFFAFFEVFMCKNLAKIKNTPFERNVFNKFFIGKVF